MSRLLKLLLIPCYLYSCIAIAQPSKPVDLRALDNNPADAQTSRDPKETLLYSYGEIYFDDRDDLLDKALEVKEEGENLEARS